MLHRITLQLPRQNPWTPNRGEPPPAQNLPDQQIQDVNRHLRDAAPATTEKPPSQTIHSYPRCRQEECHSSPSKQPNLPVPPIPPQHSTVLENTASTGGQDGTAIAQPRNVDATMAFPIRQRPFNFIQTRLPKKNWPKKLTSHPTYRCHLAETEGITNHGNRTVATADLRPEAPNILKLHQDSTNIRAHL